MGQQHFFNLGGKHVEPTDDDEVFGAIDEVHEAVAVGGADVAGAQPTIGGEHFGGAFGIVEVTLKHIGAGDPDLAGVAIESVFTKLVDDAHLHTIDDLAH